jgi:hypothetical protein
MRVTRCLMIIAAALLCRRQGGDHKAGQRRGAEGAPIARQLTLRSGSGESSHAAGLDGVLLSMVRRGEPGCA